MGLPHAFLLHMVLFDEWPVYSLILLVNSGAATRPAQKIPLDIKCSDMGSNMENDIHRPGRNGTGGGKYPFKYYGYAVRNSNRYNRTKMAEIAKMVFNYLGLTVYILGILANLNNVISVTLGFVGIAFGFVKILTAYENYLMKRMDRRDREETKKIKEEEL